MMEAFTHDGKKYVIRLLEKQDEKAATVLIWRLIYLKSGMDILVDKIMGLPFLSLSLIVGCWGFLQSEYSIAVGIIMFLTPPCSLYAFCRFMILPLEFYSSPGFSEGLFAYWSQTELGRRLWVIEVEGTIIATAAVDRLSPTAAQVFRVAVENKYRGHGLGIRLMDKVLKHCQSCGVDHIVLMTTYIQVPAIRLYEKIGFKRVGSGWYGPVPFFLKFEKYLYHLSQHGVPPGSYAGSKGLSLIRH